jgi:hypothetical protein
MPGIPFQVTAWTAPSKPQQDIHHGKAMVDLAIARYVRRTRFLGALTGFLRWTAGQPKLQAQAGGDPQYGTDAICCKCIYFRWASEEQHQKSREETGTSSRSRGNCRRYPPVFVPLVWKQASSSPEDQNQQQPACDSVLFADVTLPLFTWPIVWSRAFCGEFRMGIPTQAREQDRPHS